ncbi:hypothetical protein L1049_003044 [Liquidambar formosana]|uniref:Uncharacterized protein n=1 Tax=Liquidambar formosana TaxID=63359 RepID=A0AAP0R9A7_LIQFO
MAFFPSSPGWFHILMFLLLSVFSLFLLKQRKKGKDGAKLPPSPPRLPIIGNLHQLGKFPHHSFWKLSQKYGPLMLLHLGSIPTLVISSAEMAEEVLKTHDLDCCSRPHLPGPKKLSYSYLDVAFSPYSNFWKEKRKIFVSELLSAKGVPSLCNAREEEVNRMISSISEAIPNPVNLNEVIFALTDGIIGTFAFGKSYGGKQFENQKFRLVLDEAMNMLDSFSAEDFFPLVGRIVDALRGLGARLNKSFRGLDGYFEMVFDERLDPAARPKPVPEDLVDVLVGLWKERSGDLHMTKDHVKALLMVKMKLPYFIFIFKIFCIK